MRLRSSSIINIQKIYDVGQVKHNLLLVSKELRENVNNAIERVGMSYHDGNIHVLFKLHYDCIVTLLGKALCFPFLSEFICDVINHFISQTLKF